MNSEPQSPKNIEKSEREKTLEPIQSFIDKNPQMVDGKLQYFVCGSTAVVLFSEAENMRVCTLDEDGILTEVVEQDLDSKSRTFIKQNISKFGKPSDIDITVTKNIAVDNSFTEDQFVARGGERVLRGEIDGKEYYFEQPLDYITKLLANRYTGMSHELSKAYSKLLKMNVMLEAVTQDMPLEKIATEIEKRIESPDMQLLNPSESLQRSASEHFLSSPHSVYSWLTKSIVRDREGNRDVNIDINQFPYVKEMVDILSNRHKKNLE
jgi:hypothetical protein